MPLPVHHVRFRTARGGQPGLEAEPGSADSAGLDATVLDRLGRLVTAGCPATGASCAFTRLPEGGGVVYRVSRAPADAGIDEYEVLAVSLPSDGELGDFSPVDALADESWPPFPPDGGLLRGEWLRPGPASDSRRLVAFAQANRDVLPSILADLRALFAPQAGPQILIGEEAGPPAQWIALLAASLPACYARDLTFTTAASQPYRAVHQVVGLAADAHFDYSREELLFTYRVRGTGEQQRSGRTTDAWAEIAAALWLAGHPELLRDDRLGEGEPFDVGRLAVTALLERIPLDSASLLAGLQWLGVAANTAMVGKPDFDTLAEAVGRLAAQSAADPQSAAPAMDLAVKRAYLALRRRADPARISDLAVQAARAAMQTALADCAAVRVDPLADLALSTGVRDRVATEYAARVQALFEPAAATTREHLEGALVLARSLDVDWSQQAEGLASMFGRQLLDRGADHAAVFDLLDRLGQQRLADAVLRRLDEAVEHGDVAAVAALVSSGPGGAWFGARRITESTPLFKLVYLAADPGIARLSGVQRLEALWKQSGKPNDAQRLRVIWDLALPNQGAKALTVADARQLVTALPPDVLTSSDIGARPIEALIQHSFRPVIDDLPDLSALAEALRQRRLLSDPADDALADLLSELDRLRTAKRPDLLDTAERAEQLLGRVRDPDGLREVSLDLLAGHYYAAPGSDLFDDRVRETLPRGFGGELLRRYQSMHTNPHNRQELLGKLESADEEYLAGRFHLWFELNRAADQDTHEIGLRLLNELIDPTLRAIDKKRAKNVLKVLNKRAAPRIVENWTKHCVKLGLLEPGAAQQHQQHPQQGAQPPDPQQQNPYSAHQPARQAQNAPQQGSRPLAP